MNVYVACFNQVSILVRGRNFPFCLILILCLILSFNPFACRLSPVVKKKEQGKITFMD